MTQPRTCRDCGCDDDDACETALGPCSWLIKYDDGTGLCTGCIPEPDELCKCGHPYDEHCSQLASCTTCGPETCPKFELAPPFPEPTYDNQVW